MDKTVTMPLNQWQGLVNFLGANGKFNEVAPWITTIMQQLNGPAPPANGEARPQPQAPNG